jgi:hypothetical protein
VNTLVRTLSLLAAFVVMADCAAAAIVTLSGQSFNELSGPENLNPAFNQAGGQTTTKSYSGDVEVLVSGLGSNDIFASNMSIDAFYQVSDTNQPITLDSNTLRLGSQTQIAPIPGNFAFVPNNSEREEAGSVHVANLAIAYDGSSFAVTDPNLLDAFTAVAPVYNPNHIYHFVMDLGSYSGTLTLGNGDGGVSDNSTNSWSISLWQVAPVPEPASLVLLVVGGLALGLVRCRQRFWSVSLRRDV